MEAYLLLRKSPPKVWPQRMEGKEGERGRSKTSEIYIIFPLQNSFFLTLTFFVQAWLARAKANSEAAQGKYKGGASSASANESLHVENYKY